MGNALVMFTIPEECRPRGRFPVGSVWQPPAEPWLEHGTDWHRKPALRRAHVRAMRESLEGFLNDHLAKLDFMVRTGWFVLGKVRVRVVECRGVPERRMRAENEEPGTARKTKRRTTKAGSTRKRASSGKGRSSQ